MRPVLALLVVAALAGAGCGDHVHDPVAEAAGKLSDVRSGQLTLRLVAGAGEDEVGFEVDGRFSFDSPGPLPVARLRYARLAGDERVEATLVSTGHEAWVEAGGRRQLLPAAEQQRLRVGTGEEAGGGLDRLRLDRWAEDPVEGDGPRVDGAPTRQVEAGLRVAEALAGIVALAGELGLPVAPGFERLDGDEAERVERATERATLVLHVGEDGVLRDLDASVRFRADATEPVVRRLGPLARPHLRLTLRLRDVVHDG
jgi:hypothetical protein